MIVANNINVEGAGFAVDTNLVTIITQESFLQLPLMSKQDLAHCILDHILVLLKSKP
jgi:hypothetical protein